MEEILNSADNLAQWNKFSVCWGVRSYTVAFIRTSYWSLSSILSFTSPIFKVDFKIILPSMPRSLKFTLSCWQTFLVPAIRVTCSACQGFFLFLLCFWFHCSPYVSRRPKCMNRVTVKLSESIFISLRILYRIYKIYSVSFFMLFWQCIII